MSTKFIELTASFRNENQPSFEELGIAPSGEDFEDSDWKPVYFNPESIVSININSAGYTNLTFVNGEKWSVRERPQVIVELIRLFT